MKTKTMSPGLAAALLASACLVFPPNEATAVDPPTTEANVVAEVAFQAAKSHAEPFRDVSFDVVFTDPSGTARTVPGFWAGGNQWKVRYASPVTGLHRYRTVCSATDDSGLHGVESALEIRAYTGSNPLYRHGPVRVSANRRYFEHVDGTPFFWLGDTWWKGLCKRLTWEGFQELAADRKAKGFSVVQIVCGVCPNEGVFERHWRNIVARYGAYPALWMIGGESGGPQWTEVVRYVQKIDPYRRPSTVHPFDSGRKQVTDETVIDFDMLQTGHGDWEAARGAIPKRQAAYTRKPVKPAIIGEYCYEGHMQTAFQDVQRYVFWGTILSGSTGHTYDAAGIWHASAEGDPGILIRFHDFDHYLVALYTPRLKAIYLHDRKNGTWGELLGKVAVPDIGPKVDLTAAACGDFAARIMTNGQKTCATPGVKVANVTRGKSGLWLFQVGERQEYDNFQLSQTPFTPTKLEAAGKVHRVVSKEFKAPNVPSPQDWVLVMERVKP